MRIPHSLALLCLFTGTVSAQLIEPEPPSVQDAGNGMQTFTWPTELGHFYYSAHSSNLVDWTFLPEAWDGNGQDASITAGGTDKFFLRAHSSNLPYTGPIEDADPDNDGLSVIEELRDLNSNPAQNDTNGNGINDGMEDSDRDGIVDLYEIKKGTDPNDPGDVPPADFIVDPVTGGDDLNDNIYATIQEAVEQCPDATVDPNPYRIILVKAKEGGYEEEIVINNNRRVTLLADATFEEVILHRVVFDDLLYVFEPFFVMHGFAFEGRRGIGTMVKVIGDPEETVRFSNCIFRNGDSFLGGVFQISEATVIFDHITAFGNNAFLSGRFATIDDAANMILRNSILWGNTGAAPDDIGIRDEASSLVVENSWVETMAPGMGPLSQDPQLTRLGYLTESSPARNFASSSSYSLNDLQGELRDSMPDAGADEFINSDADSLPDIFEIYHFGNFNESDNGDNDLGGSDALSNLKEYLENTNPAQRDPDGDGQSDWQELAQGTDPLDGDSFLPVRLTLRVEHGTSAEFPQQLYNPNPNEVFDLSVSYPAAPSEWIQLSETEVTGETLNWNINFLTSGLPRDPFLRWGPARIRITERQSGEVRYEDFWTMVTSTRVNEGDNEFAFGTNGNDRNLRGLGGDDRVIGFDGDDEMFGDGGNDFLEGQNGNDTMDGGFGDDTYRIFDNFFDDFQGMDLIVEDSFQVYDDILLADLYSDNITINILSDSEFEIRRKSDDLLFVTVRRRDQGRFPNITFDDGTRAVLDENTGEFRLELNPRFTSNPADDNGNRLSDGIERLIFGSINSDINTGLGSDQNNNGIQDWWEIHFFGDLITNITPFDDGDGATILEEWEAKTDPTNPDTDGDGLTDGYELSDDNVSPLARDREMADEDSDGLTNIREELFGTFPDNPDSDNDGVFDGAEVDAGTDPLMAEDKPFDPNEFLGADINDANCEPIGILGTAYIPAQPNYFAGIQIRDTRPPPAPLTFNGTVTNLTTNRVIGRITANNIGQSYFFNWDLDPRSSYLAFGSFGGLGSGFSDPNFYFSSASSFTTIGVAQSSNTMLVPASGGIGFYLFPTFTSSWSNSYSGNEAVAPNNRKVALNGRPIPNHEPEQESESTSYKEETYVDAFSLDFHHDSSFIHVPLAASDLALQATISAEETIWSDRGGLRPHERLDLPFGTGWRSNLCSFIEISDTRGQLSNEPVEVRVIDESGRTLRFGTEDLINFFPWPSSRVDKKTYLNTLVREGDDFVLHKKYGNTLRFTPTDAWFAFPTDRIDGSPYITRCNYWRLSSVTDRYGNQLIYDYGTSQISLIPQTISSPNRPGQQIAINVSPNCRRIDSITDPKGNTISFNYTQRTISSTLPANSYSYQTLDSVDYPDGTRQSYGYNTATENQVVRDDRTNYFHSAVSTITDKRGNTHSINYEFDRTRSYFLGASGRLFFSCSFSGVPLGIRNTARSRLRQINLDAAADTTAQFITQYGVPRCVSSVNLPGGIGTASFTKTPETSLQFGAEFSAASGTVVTDAVGNTTHYDFGDVSGEVVNRATTYSGNSSSTSTEWMIYYTSMNVHHGARPGQPGFLGTESYTYDLTSGLGLASMTDLSGNMTTWDYDESLPSREIIELDSQPSFMTRWADPTGKTDALNRTESYGYGDFRVMNSHTDVHGTVTTYNVDTLGRRTSMTVVGADGVTLRQEQYDYENATYPGFMTKKTILVYSNISTQAWEVPLVTEYVPDSRGRVMQEIQDPSDPVTNPNGLNLTTTYTYDLNNNKTSVRDARNNTISFAYDTLNRLTVTTYPRAGTSTGDKVATKEILYDFNGNQAGVIDEEGNQVFYQHDALNRVTQMVVDLAPDSGAEDTVYPVKNVTNGLVPETNRGTAGASDLVTTTAYNAVNSATFVTDPRGIVTHSEYDALQRVRHVYGNWEQGDNDTVRAASSEKTHTEFQYPDTLTLDGIEFDANPGASGFSGKGFKPTVTIRHDAVRTTVGTESMTSYHICDEVYRPIAQYNQYRTDGAVFADNHQITTTDYGIVPTGVTVPSGKESLISRVTDDRGKIMQNTSDGLGRVTEVIDAVGTPDAATSTTVYSSTGLVWKQIDALNRESENEYDGVGRVVRSYAPDAISGVVNRSSLNSQTLGSPLTITEYDGNSNVTFTTNPRGFVWEYEYDARNRKTREIQPAVINAENPAVPVNNVQPVMDTFYDGIGNVIAVTDARNNSTRTVYDRAYRSKFTLSNPSTGNPSSDPANLNPFDILTETVFDKNSNVLSLEDGNGNITRNRYDALNRLVLTATDSADGDPDDPNTAGYTSGGANDIIVRNQYDDSGNLLEVSDGEQQITQFRYDGLSRKTQTTWDPGTPVERVETCTFDGIVKLSRLDPNNQNTSYTYDDQNRLEEIIYTGRTQDNRFYDYDLVDNLLSVTYPNETAANQTIRECSQTYDELNRVETETSAGRTHTYTYDKAGNRLTTMYDVTGRFLDCDYDALNRLETCTEKDSETATATNVTSYLYALNGNITRKTLPNNNYTDCSYDALNRKLTKNTFNSSNVNIVSFNYAQAVSPYPSSYDNVGNVLRIAEEYADPNVADRTVTNIYDSVYRLDLETLATSGNTTVTDYSYDKANNRSGKVVTTNGSQTSNQIYVYGDTTDTYNSNQLKSVTEGVNITTFVYDANGNRTSKSLNGTGTQFYLYDFDDRLTTVDDVAAGDYEYFYDHRTRRVLRNEIFAGGQSTQISFSGGTSVQEIEGGATTVEYIRGSDYGGGIGGVLYTVRGTNRSYNAYNSRGDVVSQTNDSQGVTWQAAYEAFGTRTEESGNTNVERQRANTKDEDPWGGLNEGMRYRDLEFGIFLTRDPLGHVDGPNEYSFVRQNPWSAFDPDGLDAEKLYRPQFWTGANLWAGRNKNSFTNLFIDRKKVRTHATKAFAIKSHGIVGTEKGGFIDIGHVRHNMDRTLSFHIQLSKMIKKQGVVSPGIKMQSHANRDSHPIAGQGIKPLPMVETPVEVTAKNVHEIAAQMAETEAKYYEDSTKGSLSYYSTEDLPSNLLGINIAKKELGKQGVGYRPTVDEWVKSMDDGLDERLTNLKDLSRKDSYNMYMNYGADVSKKTKGKNKTNNPIIFKNYDKKK